MRDTIDVTSYPVWDPCSIFLLELVDYASDVNTAWDLSQQETKAKTGSICILRISLPHFPQECGMGMYTRLYLKCITNKDLLRNTGRSSQCHVHPGREQGLGESGHMYACLSPFTAT